MDDYGNELIEIIAMLVLPHPILLFYLTQKMGIKLSGLKWCSENPKWNWHETVMVGWPRNENDRDDYDSRLATPNPFL